MNKLELPNLTRWRAGEQPDEEMFNDLQDSYEFLLDPPTVKVHKTASQNVNSGSFTSVTWNEAVEDNCKPFGVSYATAMWDPASNNKLVCRVPGWYEIQYTTAWDTTTDDARRMTLFDVNDGPETLWQRGRRDTWHLNDYTVTTQHYPVFLNVDDYVKMWVLHDKGSATNLVVTTEYGRRTQLKLKWVSL